MPINGYNPFDPFGVMRVWGDAVSEARNSAPREAKSKPIPVTVAADHPGINVTVKQSGGTTEVKLGGKARGPAREEVWMGLAPDMVHSDPLVLHLAIDEAPTTDVFGDDDYREKNARRVMVSPTKDMTGKAIAKQMAEYINDELPAFKAVVKNGRGTEATLVITRR